MDGIIIGPNFNPRWSMKAHSICVLFIAVLVVGGCSGNGEGPAADSGNPDTVLPDNGQDASPPDNGQDTGSTPGKRVYGGSASYGDLVVFSVDGDSRKVEVVNETTGNTVSNDYTVMSGNVEGVLKVESAGDTFFAVELTNKLLAASFDTGNPSNTISFGVAGGTDNIANQSNIPGDYAYIHISGQPVNGSTDIKEWGVLSIIDDGTFRVKAFASDAGDMSLGPMAPEEWAGAFPVEEPNVQGSWSVNPSDHARLVVNIDGVPATLTGFAYAPDPNGIFVLDMGTGNGFILAMKILPTMTLANLAGEYKFINVWNDSMGEGRSAGHAVVNSDGTGFFGTVDTDGGYSTGTFDYISACPNLQNMFHATSTETRDDVTVTLKHYFVLLPYAYMGFNFRTDGGFRFVGYSVGARLP